MVDVSTVSVVPLDHPIVLSLSAYFPKRLMKIHNRATVRDIPTRRQTTATVHISDEARSSPPLGAPDPRSAALVAATFHGSAPTFTSAADQRAIS